MQFLPSSGRVDTAVWMHHSDANKMAGEEARRQLHKNVASNIKQVLAQHPTKHQLYGHLPPITKTIQVRRARHAGHCWRSRDELTSEILLWTRHMAEQKQDDQLEYTYSSCVRIRDVAQKTGQRRWTIGRSGERGSWISVLAARHRGVGEGATPFPGLLHFTLDPYLIVLGAKQGGIKYHFLSLWYDSTWDWTPVSRIIGEFFLLQFLFLNVSTKKMFEEAVSQKTVAVRPPTSSL